MSLPTLQNMIPLQRDGNAVSADTATIATTANVALALYSSGTALPVAAVGYRAKVYILLNGTGVADTANVCLKGADDAYHWYAITFG